MYGLIEKYCQNYFDNYNRHYQHRDAWLKIREIRYRQISKNNFYLDEGTEGFKKEVLQFWEGRGKYKGYSYQGSYLRVRDGKWILFQNKDGETPEARKILKNIKNFRFYGNYSWSNLQRGGDITHDMGKLKRTVEYLLDEKISLVERVNNVVEPNGECKIEGISYGKATIFLHMVYPDRYCVWNGPVNEMLKILGMTDSKFNVRGKTKGEQYEKVNGLLGILKDKYSFRKYKNGFRNLSDVDIFAWYIVDKFNKTQK